MTVVKNHDDLVRKLKKQVRVLQRKEALAKTRLRAALTKIGKLGKSYKSRLASSMRAMKHRIADTEAATYAKAAISIERHIVKDIEAKGKAIKSAVARIEKKHAAKLMKNLAGKSRKAASSRKTG